MSKLILKPALFSIFFLFITSCNVFKTALYDQYSYEKVTSLKVESLHLMSEAEKPYAEFDEQVKQLVIEIEKLTEYEKNKPNNELSYGMLQLLKDPEKSLLGGFFKRWEEKNTLSKVFVDESKKQVEEAFDLLIKYESSKDKEEISSYLNTNK